MRRLLLAILILAISFSVFASDNTQSLVLETFVPENYGINVPDEALKLDQFVFEFESESGIGEILTDSRFSIGNFENSYMQEFTLLYYGNLSQDYSVRISADTGEGFILQSAESEDSIPVLVKFEEPDDKPEDIVVVCDEEYARASVFIPSGKQRRGVEALDMVVLWTDAMDLLPGKYDLTVDIELLSSF